MVSQSPAEANEPTEEPLDFSSRLITLPVAGITGLGVERRPYSEITGFGSVWGGDKGQAAQLSDPTSWICGMLQASDSLFPTGSYAHSFGLEGFVQEGAIRDRETLRTFLLHSTLPALRQTELPIAAHAWRAFAVPDWNRIGELCALSSALKTAREARAASENIGRQRADLVASLRDSSLAQEFLKHAAENNWPCAAPVVAALEGTVLGAPLPAVLAAVCYSNLASILSAAMK